MVAGLFNTNQQLLVARNYNYDCATQPCTHLIREAYFLPTACSFISGPSFIYTGVQTCIMQKQGGLYFVNILCWGLTSIKRNCGCKDVNTNSHHIGNSSAKTKACHACFAVAVLMRNEVIIACNKIFEPFISVTLRLHLTTLIIIARNRVCTLQKAYPVFLLSSFSGSVMSKGHH